MERRTFLGITAGAAAMPMLGQRAGIRLGIDAYSIRGWSYKAPALIEYSAALKVDVLQFSNLDTFESLEPGYLSKLKDAGRAAKLDFEIGLGSICPTSAGWNKRNGTPVEYLSTALRTAATIGAPIVKTYVGASNDRRGVLPIERHIDETLKVLKSVQPLARDLGVKVAMENHSGDLTARELRALIEAAGRNWVGCCLDTGNPALTLEDPLRVLEILGPYTLTTHIRDVAIFQHPQGAAWQWVALGDGNIDWVTFLERHSTLCPGAAFLLENITGRPPRVAAWMEQEFWKPFPKANAADFAAFVRFAKGGSPLMAPMIVADVAGEFPQDYKLALKQQQKYDLEKGIEFAKKKLGVGLNWR